MAEKASFTNAGRRGFRFFFDFLKPHPDYIGNHNNDKSSHPFILQIIQRRYDALINLLGQCATKADIEKLPIGGNGAQLVSIHDEEYGRAVPGDGEIYIVKFHDIPYGDGEVSEEVFYRIRIGDGETPLKDLPDENPISSGEGRGSAVLRDPSYGEGTDGADSGKNTASGQYGVALGKYLKNEGKAAAAFNYSNEITENGERSFACVFQNLIDALQCFVAGNRNEAYARDSRIVGAGNKTEKSATGSTILGIGNISEHLHVLLAGIGLLSAAEKQIVLGAYNKKDEDARLILAAGDPETGEGKNILAAKKDGSLELMGATFTEERMKLLSESPIFRSINISAPEGATVYCKNDEVMLETISDGEIITYNNIPYGRWIIGATLTDGATYERKIVVDDKELPTLYFDTPAESFFEASLESIVMACQCGKVPDTWNPGDETTISIDGTAWDIVIIGKNADTFAQTGASAPLTLQFNLIYQRGKFNLNTDGTERWDESYLRKNILPAILAKFPDVLKASIAPVRLSTIIGAGNYIETEDYLFLPSREDLEVTQIYEHYSDAASRIKYEASGTPYKCWLRSTWIQTSRGNALDILSATGSFSYGTENSANGISPAFCIGPTYTVWEEDENQGEEIDLSGYVTKEELEKAISGAIGGSY